jgi:hypothetical protein
MHGVENIFLFTNIYTRRRKHKIRIFKAFLKISKQTGTSGAGAKNRQSWQYKSTVGHQWVLRASGRSTTNLADTSEPYCSTIEYM